MNPALTRSNAEFYEAFWSLQLPFSKPSVFLTPSAFDQFQENLQKVLPVIKEATAKERAGASSLKRKRDALSEEGASNYLNEPFFPKFLTSPDLLDLEVLIPSTSWIHPLIPPL